MQKLSDEVSKDKDRGELPVAIETTQTFNEMCVSMNETNQRLAALEHMEEEMKAMRLTWTSAHAMLTQDMRELLTQYQNATPLKLASFVKELRQDLMDDGSPTSKIVAGKLQLFDTNSVDRFPNSIAKDGSLAG